MPFYRLKIGPLFWFVCCFLFQKSHSPCRKKMIFEKQATTTTKTYFYKLEFGAIMLRNILGPVFNLYLDQLLTYNICYFLFFGRNPYVYSVFSKNAKFKETQKSKKDTICEHNCCWLFLSKCPCFFFCIFHFCCFWNFIFFRDVFDRIPKSKNNKIPKQHKNNNNRKQDAKEK